MRVSAVFAYLSGIMAVRRLGSSLASFVALTEVIFAVVFAIILLGQRPSIGQLVGGALVLAGIAVIQRRSTATPLPSIRHAEITERCDSAPSPPPKQPIRHLSGGSVTRYAVG